MQKRKLGRTDIEVTLICLGTMTWGQQNTEAEAHEQIDAALDAGINFIDTAEMYPVPAKAETCTLTEQYIGSWMANNKARRDSFVLASKVAGPMRRGHVRDGRAYTTKADLTEALEGSLSRLNTDYLDLYQLHWPARPANFFGQLGYTRSKDHNPAAELAAMETTLEVLANFQKQGKVRHFGISNETPWGAMTYLRLAEQNGWPRMVSIQNPYNLLNRSFEVGLAELSHREDLGLLAYSPLAFGALSGKYLDGKRPEGARMTDFTSFQRYMGDYPEFVIRQYVELAQAARLDPAQMALAFVNSREFTTSNIIGATTMDQLKSNIASAEIHLSPEVFKAIEDIHNVHSNPCP